MMHFRSKLTVFDGAIVIFVLTLSARDLDATEFSDELEPGMGLLIYMSLSKALLFTRQAILLLKKFQIVIILLWILALKIVLVQLHLVTLRLVEFACLAHFTIGFTDLILLQNATITSNEKRYKRLSCFLLIFLSTSRLLCFGDVST